MDMWDLKPNAPVDIRGEFNPIKTNVPGIDIGEHFPQMAKMMDKFAIIRSITNAHEEHSSSHLASGYWVSERDTSGDRPSLGSVLSHYVAKPDARISPYVSLRPITHESGLGAAYLGGGCEPLYSAGEGLEDLSLRNSMNLGRFAERRKLLERLDGARAAIDASPAVAKRRLSTVRAPAAQQSRYCGGSMRITSVFTPRSTSSTTASFLLLLRKSW